MMRRRSLTLSRVSSCDLPRSVRINNTKTDQKKK
jgi:hypothetical protein